MFFFWWTELVLWRRCDQLLSLAAGKATFFSREIDKGMVNVSSSPKEQKLNLQHLDTVCYALLLCGEYSVDALNYTKLQ